MALTGSQRARRRLSPADRRQRILEEAVLFFAEVGFDGGTRLLAERLGCTQPLIFRYFPTKDDLIRAVYETVFLKPWQSHWTNLLLDRSRSLKDRLISFYLEYTDIIHSPTWIRIYLFSGLKGLEINRWYITFVEERILQTVCQEIRAAYELPGTDVVPIQPREIEAFWTFHGGIFYYGVRREVYKIPAQIDVRSLIEASVEALLEGFPAVMAREIDSKLAS